MQSQELVSDIVAFCDDIHKSKIEVIIQLLNRRFGQDLVQLDQITDTIKLVDGTIGLREELSTDYRRKKYIKEKFNFIEPERIPIGDWNNITCFYWYMCIEATLLRLLQDNSLREYMINQPVFFEQKVFYILHINFTYGATDATVIAHNFSDTLILFHPIDTALALVS